MFLHIQFVLHILLFYCFALFFILLHILLLISFFTYIYIYILLCGVTLYNLILILFLILFLFFALSTEQTWFDLHFTFDYTLYNLSCDK